MIVASVPYVAGYLLFILALVLIGHWAYDQWKDDL